MLYHIVLLSSTHRVTQPRKYSQTIMDIDSPYESGAYYEAIDVFRASNYPDTEYVYSFPVEVPSVTIAVRGGSYMIEGFVGEAKLTVVDYDNFREEVYTSEDDCTEIDWRHPEN